MRKLTIDFNRCPGEKQCNACESIQKGVVQICRQNGGLMFKHNGWAEAEIISKLISRCPKGAVTVQTIV